MGFAGVHLHGVVLFGLTKGIKVNCSSFYSNGKELRVVRRGKKKFVINLFLPVFSKRGIIGSVYKQRRLFSLNLTSNLLN